MKVRIVYNRILGGWYVVQGPHQSPLSSRFDSKAEAQQWLADRKAARDCAACRRLQRAGFGRHRCAEHEGGAR